MKDYEQPTVGRLSGGVAEYFYHMGITHRITRSGGAQVSLAITGQGSDSGPDTTKCGRDRIRVGSPSPLLSSLWANGKNNCDITVTGGRPASADPRLPLPARAFKHPLCITLLQIARNPFFFFRLVFLVTRRDAARLARRVGFWARRAGD
jgi:hypothetical protein